MAGVICYNLTTERIKDMMPALVRIEPDASNYIEVTDVSMPAMKELVLSLATASDNEKLIYFPYAEQIEPRTQDVLLKSIEDRDDLCFLFKSEKKLIPTIESRCRIFYGARLGEEEYVEWLKEEKHLLTDSDRWLYWFTNGDKELTEEVMGNVTLLMLMRKFDKERQLTDKKSLLKTFSLLREKDEKAFFYVYREYVPCLYRLIEHMLFTRLLDGEDEKQTTDALNVLQKHMKMERSRTYTAADMVDCLLGL